MRALGLFVTVIALTGCATVVPMQTASVVPEGQWRVGGQASAAGFCSDNIVLECHDWADGAPMPELRLNARRGVGEGTDVGASLQFAPNLLAVERMLQVGLALEAKREFFRWDGEGHAHVLSAGLLTAGAIAGRTGLAPWLQSELALPVYYGFQTRRFEWVAGGSVSWRQLFPSVGGEGDTDVIRAWRVGVNVGLFRRAPTAWAFQLGYLTRPERPLDGAVLLQYGWFFDL